MLNGKLAKWQFCQMTVQFRPIAPARSVTEMRNAFQIRKIFNIAYILNIWLNVATGDEVQCG